MHAQQGLLHAASRLHDQAAGWSAQGCGLIHSERSTSSVLAPQQKSCTCPAGVQNEKSGRWWLKQTHFKSHSPGPEHTPCWHSSLLSLAAMRAARSACGRVGRAARGRARGWGLQPKPHNLRDCPSGTSAPCAPPPPRAGSEGCKEDEGLVMNQCSRAGGWTGGAQGAGRWSAATRPALLPASVLTAPYPPSCRQMWTWSCGRSIAGWRGRPCQQGRRQQGRRHHSSGTHSATAAAGAHRMWRIIRSTLGGGLVAVVRGDACWAGGGVWDGGPRDSTTHSSGSSSFSRMWPCASRRAHPGGQGPRVADRRNGGQALRLPASQHRGPCAPAPAL